MKYVKCVDLYSLHTLKIWGAGVNSPQSYGADFVFFCLFFFVCPSRYDARHRHLYALNLGGTGISPPDSFSYRSSFRFHSRFRSRSNFRSSSSFSFRSSSSSTTSGDIFYCSGSRQLNHSSFYCNNQESYCSANTISFLAHPMHTYEASKAKQKCIHYLLLVIVHVSHLWEMVVWRYYEDGLPADHTYFHIYIFISPGGSTSQQQKKRNENRQSMSRRNLTDNKLN